jgi:hypothetical protein
MKVVPFVYAPGVESHRPATYEVEQNPLSERTEILVRNVKEREEKISTKEQAGRSADSIPAVL